MDPYVFTLNVPHYLPPWTLRHSVTDKRFFPQLLPQYTVPHFFLLDGTASCSGSFYLELSESSPSHRLVARFALRIGLRRRLSCPTRWKRTALAEPYVFLSLAWPRRHRTRDINGMGRLPWGEVSDSIKHHQYSILSLHSPFPSFTPNHAPRFLPRDRCHSFLFHSFPLRSRCPARIPLWLPEGSRCEFGGLALIVSPSLVCGYRGLFVKTRAHPSSILGVRLIDCNAMLLKVY